MFRHFPITLGLTLCEDVIVEQPSRNISVIRSFTGLPVERFPCVARPLCALAALTNGEGQGEVMLTVGIQDAEFDTLYRVKTKLHFHDPIAVLYYVMRLSHCPLPRPGPYVFTPWIDGVWMAQRSLRVYLRGATP